VASWETLRQRGSEAEEVNGTAIDVEALEAEHGLLSTRVGPSCAFRCDLLSWGGNDARVAPFEKRPRLRTAGNVSVSVPRPRGRLRRRPRGRLRSRFAESLGFVMQSWMVEQRRCDQSSAVDEPAQEHETRNTNRNTSPYVAGLRTSIYQGSDVEQLTIERGLRLSSPR